MSRQAWYERKNRQEKCELYQDLLLNEVRKIRLELPSVGVEILHHQLKEFRKLHGIKIGRDKFAKLLRVNDLLIKRRKSYIKTTCRAAGAVSSSLLQVS